MNSAAALAASVAQPSVRGLAHETLVASACRKNTVRLVVLLAIAYIINYLDRNNVAFAALTMNSAVGLTGTQFGMGAGLVFASYCTLEIPSNLITFRVGARRWLARIMITWGIAAAATAFVVGPSSFYIMRFVLGAAEAGFTPGVLLYLTVWFPVQYRTRVLSLFLLGVPVSSLIGGPISGTLLEFDGWLGLAGWQWLFLIEAVPAIIAGILTFRLLVDDPRDAKWLTQEERAALLEELSRDSRGLDRPQHGFWTAFADRRVLLMTTVQFGFTIGAYGVSMWLPLILKQHALSNLQVGFVTTIPYGFATVGMLLWARHIDAGGDKILNLTLACLLAVVGFVISVVFTSLVPAVAGLTVALVGITAARNVFWSIPPRFLVGAAAASGLAFINSVGTIGGWVGPVLMGWLKDRTGSFTPGLAAMAAILLLTAGLAASVRLVTRNV